MEINADFSRRVVIDTTEMSWTPSPMKGVDRRMLDRIGDEVARATSIVRYAPGSHFSPHTHSGGEEFVVLDGVFQDEHGDYPAGSYIRNPPTSSHTPGSENGCTIFVKLWQFEADDRTMVKIDMNKMFSVRSAENAGVLIMPLFQDERETVQLETWGAGAEISKNLPNGGEYLVLDGEFKENRDKLQKHSWLRIPRGGALNAIVGTQGAKVWSKTRHLRYTAPPV